MANITPVPILLNNSTLKIATDNYEASVSEVLLTPTSPVTVFNGMTPEAVIPVAGNPSWVVRLSYAQDHASASSLSEYLRINAGTTKEIEFAPVKAGPTYKISVVIVPGPIGGQGNTLATASVDLSAVGQPVRTPAA